MKGKLKQNFYDLLSSSASIHLKFFNLTALCFLVVFVANFIFSYTYPFSTYARMIYLIASLFSIVITIIFNKSNSAKGKEKIIVIFCLMINVVFLPLLYVTCGGIHSSVAIYFILGIVFSILNLSKKQLMIILPIETVVYLLTFGISYFYPKFDLFFMVVQNERFVATALGSIITGLALGATLRCMVVAFEYERNQVQSLVGKLEDLTTHDALTGAYNRRYLMSYLDDCIEKVNEGDLNTFSIIMFDLDHFKRVNDTYGHVVGDEVLKSFANVLKSSMRHNDVVARYGGEEFIIVLPTSDELCTYRRAEQIRAKLESTVLSDKLKERVTVSGGVCGYDLVLSSDSIIEKADNNLYIAKDRGRNQIVWKSGGNPPLCYSVFE